MNAEKLTRIYNKCGALLGELLGDRQQEEHFKRTHERMADVFIEYSHSKDFRITEAQNMLRKFIFTGPSIMITCRNVVSYGLCPHHFMLVRYSSDFSYIPSDKENNSVGLSKLARMIKILSKQAITQEELTEMIVTTFNDSISPHGSIVVMKGEHNCVSARGVESRESDIITSAIKGEAFERPEVRQEFFSLIK